MSDVKHLEMSAIDFAVGIMRCQNDIQKDNWLSKHGLEPREKILVFSTGFVMTPLGHIVTNELPSYAATHFWNSVSGGDVYDKHTRLPFSGQAVRQTRTAVRQSDVAPITSQDGFVRLEKVKGQNNPIFVATRHNGNSHSNPDLDSLMDEIGMSMEQLESEGTEINL